MKKKWIYWIALTLAICCILTGIPSTPANAATKTVTGVETGFAYKSGRYIYYAFEMEGVRTNIMRLDTKTKKKKSIVSYKYKGEPTNGFYNLTVKGKYIYAVWDLAYGTGDSESYIYRFSKDGKSRKKLACGEMPVIIKDRIYYEKCTLERNSYCTTQPTGKIYSMKLDGTDKKKVGTKKSLKLKARAWYNDYSNSTPPLTIGNYKYYVGNSGRTIYRYNKKTKKTNKVITYPKRVDCFMVQGDYVIAKGCKVKQHDNYYIECDQIITYCVKTNGKDKLKLISWQAAE